MWCSSATALSWPRRSIADHWRHVGTPAIAVEGVGARPFSGTGWYAVSRAGTLVYASAVGLIDHALVWVDRGGRVTPATPHHKAYATPRLAPDGSRIVATIYAADGTPDLWAYDLQRGSTTRLTFEGLNTGATWSPDGKLIAFAARRAGDRFFKPWVMSPDGGGARRLQVNDLPSWSTSWSADGKRLAISQLGGSSGWTSWSLRRTGRHRRNRSSKPTLRRCPACFLQTAVGWHTCRTNQGGSKSISATSP